MRLEAAPTASQQRQCTDIFDLADPGIEPTFPDSDAVTYLPATASRG